MSDVIPKTNYSVAVLVYEGADALDFTGPMQVLSQVSGEHNGELAPVFEFKVIARNPLTLLASSMTVESDITIQNTKSITDFDVLIVPGAPSAIIQALIEKDSPETDLIRQYATSTSTRPRLILSVCTGTFLLAAAGLLSGLTVTTHHRAIDELKELCVIKDADWNTTPTTVVHRRFVDGGLLPGTRVQVITSGGITAGIDVAFYIVCKLLNAEAASSVSCALEYGWTEPEGGDWPVQFDSRFDS